MSKRGRTKIKYYKQTNKVFKLSIGREQNKHDVKKQREPNENQLENKLEKLKNFRCTMIGGAT